MKKQQKWLISSLELQPPINYISTEHPTKVGGIEVLFTAGIFNKKFSLFTMGISEAQTP